MRTGKPTDLAKCIREERQLRTVYVLSGLCFFALSIYWLHKAHGQAVAFITLICSQETSLVFGFAFTAVVGVGFCVMGVSFLLCAAISAPTQKSVRILSERIAELENETRELSEPTVGGDSETRETDGATPESARL